MQRRMFSREYKLEAVLGSRLIDPPCNDRCDVARCGEVYHELVVSRGDTPPVFETAECPLDDIPSSVCGRVERSDPLSGWVVGNDWFRAACCQEATQGVAVIGRICGAQACWRQCFKERDGNGCITSLPRRYSQRDWTAATIDNSMDFCRSAASRATDCLGICPPFPPAAERCAFAIVLSIIWMSRSVVCTKASNSRRHIPLADQRWKRL